MRTIWKAKLKASQEMVLEVPRESVFLDVQLQHGVPVLWFEVDTDLPMEERSLYLATTGSELPEDRNLAYVATFQSGDGTLVFHLFDTLGKNPVMPKTGLGRSRKRKSKEKRDGKKSSGDTGRADGPDVRS